MKKYQILFLLCLLPLFAQAGELVLIKGIYYNLNGTEAEVTNSEGGYLSDDSYNCYSGAVNIPESVEYSVTGKTYKVTSIGEYAFAEGSSTHPLCGLRSVTIPNSVTSIGEYAFAGCKDLPTVTIPNSVTSIGKDAFQSCDFNSVTLGTGVTSIGRDAFRYCSSLTSVTALMPTPVEIDKDVFSNRTNATLYVPKGSKSLYENANYWKDFKNIVEAISFADENVKALCLANWDTDHNGWLSYEEAEAVTDLGEVFKNNTDITSFDELQYFTGLTAVGGYAFVECSSLTSVTIPNSVTAIGTAAFNNCSSLTSLTIPNGVTSIGYGTFMGCIGLTSLTIPNSVTSIDEWAFAGSGLTSVTIGSGVTSISTGAFANCIGLTSVTLPSSVTSIGGDAFAGCGLTSVTIPNSVTSIGQLAFWQCNNLTSVTIGSGVTSIDNGAFYECYKLTSVTALMPTPVDIAERVFTNRTNATLYVPKGSMSLYANADYWKEFKNIVEAIIFADTRVKNLCVKNWDKNKDGELSYEEAAAVKDLGKVFTNNVNITSFDELQYFTGLATIGETAFRVCRGLTSVTLPENVTSIGKSAFQGCVGLTSVTIPESVTSIGYGAFEACNGLTSLMIGNKVASIGPGAFTSCISLTSVNIPENVKSIGESAFANCTGLISVNIGSGVTSIGSSAFLNCTSLKHVYCYAESVPSTGNGVFDKINLQAATLHVPASALETYSNTMPWSRFGTKVPLSAVPTGLTEVASVPVQVKSRGGVITVEGLDNNTLVTVYTAGGALVGTATAVNHTATIATRLMPGSVAIVKMGGKKVKMVVR